MKVGIYSGTFDPVHKGHIMFASEVIEKFKLDKVFFLPEPRPRRKQGIKAFEHRVNMLKLATKHHDQLGVIVLEQARFTPSETMPVLHERFKGSQIYMLMGDDMLDHFIEWPDVAELIKAISFIIAVRKYDEDHINKMAETIKQVKGLELNYQTDNTTLSSYSSRSIRSNIKRSHDYTGLIKSVENYIKKNNLYSLGEK